jgi:hypothetical protein
MKPELREAITRQIAPQLSNPQPFTSREQASSVRRALASMAVWQVERTVEGCKPGTVIFAAGRSVPWGHEG